MAATGNEAVQLRQLKSTIQPIQEQINNLKQRGRYLALWDCTTGLPTSYPTPSSYPYTYEYKTGDYFIITQVGANSNKKPSGTSISKASASADWVIGSTDESNAVKVNDTYYFDGTNWNLQKNTQDISTLVTDVTYDGSVDNCLKQTKNGTTTNIVKLKVDKRSGRESVEIDNDIVNVVTRDTAQTISGAKQFSAGSTYFATNGGADVDIMDGNDLASSNSLLCLQSNNGCSINVFNMNSSVPNPVVNITNQDTSYQLQFPSKTGTLATTDLVSASTSGTATTEAKYLTINGTEWKLPTGGGGGGDYLPLSGGTMTGSILSGSTDNDLGSVTNKWGSLYLNNQLYLGDENTMLFNGGYASIGQANNSSSPTIISQLHIGYELNRPLFSHMDSTTSTYISESVALMNDIPNIPTTTEAGKVLKSTSTAGTVEWGDAGGGNITISSTGVTDGTNTYNASNKLSKTENTGVVVLGTTKDTTSLGGNQLVAPNGMIFSGTAANAGLVTRGICGVTTPTETGACSKDNLYINYDGNNNFNTSRQIVLQAGSIGTHLGSNMYEYCVPRGDIVKAWVEAKGYITSASVNDGILTIQKNGTDIATFTANDADNVTADITVPDVVDNVTSTSATNALSANMGKNLQDQISNLKNIGRFLAILNASAGTVSSQPSGSVGDTYTYKVGDYYRIGAAGNKGPKSTLVYTIDSNSGSSNFEAGSEDYSIGDVIYCSNITASATTWVRQASSGGGTVQDVTVNGTSVLSGGIANIDISGKIDTAGTGLSKSGTTLNHSNSITAQATQAVYPIKIDAQGHISAYGSAVTSMPASDVYSWAKASSKPSYSLSEISSSGEAYLEWGGRNIIGNVSPIDGAIEPGIAGNKYAHCSAASIKIEYSTDSGSTWTDYGATSEQKIGLTTLTNGSFSLGKGSTTSYAANRLRVTLNSNIAGGNVYTSLRKILIYLTTNGASGTQCQVTYRTVGNYVNNVDTWETLGTYSVAGWAGWNSIPFDTPFGAAGSSQTSQTAQIRLTFIQSGGTNNMNVQQIKVIGITNWAINSNMGKTGHLYDMDAWQNATFPSDLYLKGNDLSLGNSACHMTYDSTNKCINFVF